MHINILQHFQVGQVPPPPLPMPAGIHCPTDDDDDDYDDDDDDDADDDGKCSSLQVNLGYRPITLYKTPNYFFSCYRCTRG